MAKSEEKEFSLMQMPIPNDIKTTRTLRADWTGLNLRQTTDTGELSMERNISTLETPYLTPSQSRNVFKQYPSMTPIGLFGFEDFLLYVYEKDNKILIDYIKSTDNDESETIPQSAVADSSLYTREPIVYNGVLQDSLNVEGCGADVPRQIVKFNVYVPADETDANGKYVYKLLIFPDRKSMDFYIDDENGLITEEDVEENENVGSVGEIMISDMANINPQIKNFYNKYEPYNPEGADQDKCEVDIEYSGEYWYINTYNNLCFKWSGTDANDGEWVGCVPYGFPKLKYVTVHLSRLFGVDDDNVYASGFNDYSNWDLDTAEDYNDAHAWTSAAQSNTKANGSFTGIFTYQNHVVLFKDDFMHELTNTKNPFRINDIFAEGTFDARTIQDVDGKLIFVSRDGVKAYTGGNPKIIGYKLNIDRFTHAVSGTDNRRYYLYCDTDKGKRLFVYDTYFDRWAEESVDEEIIAFANNKNGLYMLTESGDILKTDTGEYDVEWKFETEFFLGETINIKHIRKLQLLADIADGSRMKMYLLYDGEEFDENNPKKYHLVYDSDGRKTALRKSSTGKDKGKFIPIRIMPRKTANFGFKLHAEGYGYVKLHQLEMYLSSGGTEYR